MTPTDESPAPQPHPIESVVVGEYRPLNGRVTLVEYDPRWPSLFECEAARIRQALGDRVRRLEHAGSTSVPGLAAKPRIDIVLAVPDSANEPAYVPDLEAAGYVLRIREPDWFEHRMFKGPDTDINLHTFSEGSPEIAKMLLFRDWVRSHPDERDVYERTKRALAEREWTHVQEYADAKTVVVRRSSGAPAGNGRTDSQGDDEATADGTSTAFAIATN